MSIFTYHLIEALTDIVKQMPKYIKRTNGIVQILNPVNPNENFAEKWQENPDKETTFMAWMIKVQADLEAMIGGDNISKVSERLKGAFGTLAVTNAFSFGDAVYAGTVSVVTNKHPETIIRNPIRPWRSNEY